MLVRPSHQAGHLEPHGPPGARAEVNGPAGSGSGTPRVTRIGEYRSDGATETRRRASRGPVQAPGRSGPHAHRRASRRQHLSPHARGARAPAARRAHTGSRCRRRRHRMASPADWTTRTSPTEPTSFARERFDSAGNEQSTNREISGRVAARRVPERINTRLVAGQVKHVTARRTRGGRRRTRRVIVVRPTVPYGHTIPIRGRLTTPGGNPVAGGGVEVWEHASLAGAVWRRIALIDTNAAGRFKFKALRGPSRVLRFRYPGTALVRARTTEVEIKVKATSTISSNRTSVVNGDEIILRGQVLGRPLPAVGKLVQLQAYSRGRWLTFATPRASARSGRGATNTDSPRRGAQCDIASVPGSPRGGLPVRSGNLAVSTRIGEGLVTKSATSGPADVW